MAAHAAVACGNERCAARPPGYEHALDRGRRELGAVREDDDGCLDAGVERREPTAQRGARPAFPVRAVDRALERVRSRDDDDLVDPGQLFEDGGEK